jgi:hypothetical protein
MPWATRVSFFEANGTDLPDALSAVLAGVTAKAAILLTNGFAQAAATSTYLAATPSQNTPSAAPRRGRDLGAIALAGAHPIRDFGCSAVTYEGRSAVSAGVLIEIASALQKP